MTSDTTRFPRRRAAAERNREKLLTAARATFADADGEVSMAEVARRAGVGMATLYRNFPGRLDLLEAVYDEEVDVLCAAAEGDESEAPGEAFTGWLRRFFAFVPSKRLIIAELLEHAEPPSPILARNRERVLRAGQPLLDAAQRSGEIRDDLDLVQILDMVVAVARTRGGPSYVEPMLRVVFDGLRPPRTAG